MKMDEINPWWKTSNVEPEYADLKSRDLLKELLSYIDDRQILSIVGLRRTGKTVLMHQLIDHLLKKQQKELILYYNFDLFDEKIEKILEYYKEAIGVDLKKDKIFVFLDEIQKHDNWENDLKVLYDNYRNIKFFISGSSSLFLEKKSKESLGGRIFTFGLHSLTFKEYLRIKNIKFDEKRINLYENELTAAMKHYLRIGGFPELLDISDEGKINRYMKELIIDKIIYIDIPKVFEINEPELLIRIFSIISSTPGMLVEYDSLASDLKRNRKTISNYLFYLEKAFLVKKVYNYSKNLLTSEKKLKRFYPSSTAFAYLFDAELGRVIENAALMSYDFKFFFRAGAKEVDFIMLENKILPIEVKYTMQVKERELKGLLWFMAKNSIAEGLVITKDYDTEKQIGDFKIRFIPLWRWLLSSN